MSVLQDLLLRAEEEEGSRVLYWQAVVCRLLAACNLVPAGLIEHGMLPRFLIDIPDGAHERVYEELVLLGGSLLARVPHLAVAALHEPPLEIYGMADVRVRRERVGGERQRLERRVEVGDAVLGEETDEVQAADGVLAGRWREGGAGRVL